jgi:predicted lipid-binding transport protein (Tim44 family)
MKTDDVSEEAEEPPGKTSGEPEKSGNDAIEENEELEWARRHVPRGRIKQPETRPAVADAKPAKKTATKPAAQPTAQPAAGSTAGAAFRKTELRDRPPIFRPEEPVVREKTLLRMMGQDAAIPYTEYEDALRILTGTIVQRQEKIAERLAGEIDELHDRIDILEDRIEMAFDHIRHRISSLEKERES